MSDHDGDPYPTLREELQTAEKGRQQDQAIRLTKLLLFFAFLSVMAVIGLIVVVQGTNKSVKELGDSSDRLSDSSDEIKASVSHLEDFVEELEAEDPEAEARSAAINEAVIAVPGIVTELAEIKSILCRSGAYANAPECQEGG